MNSRQRMQAVLEGEPADRVPWAPELNAHFIDRLLNEGRKATPEEVSNTYLAGCQRIGADMLGSAELVKEHVDNVTITTATENNKKTTTYATPVGNLTMGQVSDSVARTDYTTRFLVEERADFEAYRYMVEHTRYEPSFDQMKLALEQSVEGGLVSITIPATPLMHFIMMHMGLEHTLFNVFDHRKEMIGLMDVMHEKNKELVEIACSCEGPEIVRPFEDTSSTLTSPDMYAQLCVPHLNDYARIAHKHGKLFIPHMCGYLKEMLPVLKDTEIDGIEAVTPPELGNAPVRMARNVLGAQRVLIGGLDPTIFSFHSQRDVATIIEQTLDSMKDDKRFMLSCEEISVKADIAVVMSVARIVASRT